VGGDWNSKRRQSPHSQLASSSMEGSQYDDENSALKVKELREQDIPLIAECHTGRQPGLTGNELYEHR